MPETNIARQVKTYALCGILAIIVLAAVLLAANLLPGLHAKQTADYLEALGRIESGPLTILVFLFTAAFGPLATVAFYGICLLQSLDKPSAPVKIGMIFSVGAFLLVEAMLIVQFTVNIRLGRMYQAADEAGKAAFIPIYRGLQSSGLGLDLAWDVFIVVAVILFATSMFRSRFFGKFYGASGIVIAVLLLVLNAATAPDPPGGSGLVDIGPLLFIWILLVSIKSLRASKHIVDR